MFTSWRSAVSYAAIVTLVSLAVGEVGNFLWSPELPSRDWVMNVLLTPDRLAFPLVAIVVLVEARLLLPPLSRWSTAGIDTGLYALVLLLVTAAEAVTYDGSPADSAFLMLIFALLTLQLPAVFALSAWRHGHLTPTGRAALTS
ncbi:hypothetical protein HLK59_10855 [Streptomyces sp. S3(2020)]|uniref:hypothetical protein n=1 Tax=Streptomyces sp. S3(2020) TaxID=2732044 RepID=UPI001489E742|nr:hypothetical protein [Streptomyces sp. S3(2020)]NNN30857.1 hypothetical protein [Streptomyces sp. S3(2020)]